MRVGAYPIETNLRPHFSSGREPEATANATAGSIHPQPITGEKWRLDSATICPLPAPAHPLVPASNR